MSAVFSDDGVYRYSLARQWLLGQGVMMVVMLNPSTADAIKNDPTVARCIDFAQRWGYQSLIVTNIFAARSTDPKKLMKFDDPIGPENDEWIRRHAAEADRILLAWGADIMVRDRQPAVLELLRERSEDLYCLGLTAGGHPRHPLYVKAETKPQRFELPIGEDGQVLVVDPVQIPNTPDGWLLEVLEKNTQGSGWRAIVRARNRKTAERFGVTAIAALDTAIAALNPYYVPTRGQLATFVIGLEMPQSAEQALDGPEGSVASLSARS